MILRFRTTILLCLVAMAVLAPVQASIVNQFLAKLNNHRFIGINTVLADIKDLVDQKTELQREEEMDLEIIEDLSRKILAKQEKSVRLMSKELQNEFNGYKDNWIKNMRVKLMAELNFDMTNLELLQEAERYPQKFSLNYETYKVLLKPL